MNGMQITTRTLYALFLVGCATFNAHLGLTHKMEPGVAFVWSAIILGLGIAVMITVVKKTMPSFAFWLSVFHCIGFLAIALSGSDLYFIL